MEIVHIAAGDYPCYEELLLKRDQLKKDALQYRRTYIREFGDLINKIFEKQISCIALKKSIAFCQLAINQGKKPDIAAMNEYVTAQMTAYRLQLNEMISELNSTKTDTVITEADSQEIKAIYRKIARLLHPDMSNLPADNPELTELWNQVCIAYKCNDLKSLQETDILIQQAIARLGGNIDPVVIPDLPERITALEKEIHTIVTTEPYSYKELLENEAAIAEKKSKLESEFKEYCEYESQLKNQLDSMTKEDSYE